MGIDQDHLDQDALRAVGASAREALTASLLAEKLDIDSATAAASLHRLFLAGELGRQWEDDAGEMVYFIAED